MYSKDVTYAVYQIRASNTDRTAIQSFKSTLEYCSREHWAEETVECTGKRESISQSVSQSVNQSHNHSLLTYSSLTHSLLLSHLLTRFKSKLDYCSRKHWAEETVEVKEDQSINQSVPVKENQLCQ